MEGRPLMTSGWKSMDRIQDIKSIKTIQSKMMEKQACIYRILSPASGGRLVETLSGEAVNRLISGFIKGIPEHICCGLNSLTHSYSLTTILSLSASPGHYV